MELYLDSADINEIKEAFQLGYLTGLTTTPTFMHRHGVTDIDGLILELSKLVPVLQIEALGNTAEEVLAEAERLLSLGLDKEKTVFKVPMSLEGTRACRMLRERDMLVNLHLVYTLQQAYLAMEAGATYVCPLVGRLQDQGHDALNLVSDCVDTVNYYGYDTKVMFSSVRTVEHIRNALAVGVHTITVPWKIMRVLADNHFTQIGTQQFIEHTRLLTVRVGDILLPKNPVVKLEDSMQHCLLEMTNGGYGAVAVVDDQMMPKGIITDGDVRRMLDSNGQLKHNKVGEVNLKTPLTIEADALLEEASNLFKSKQVDTLIVTQNGRVIGMLDIQQLVSDSL